MRLHRVVEFPRKNVLSVLAAGDEKEHHGSKEGTGWGVLEMLHGNT